MPTNHLIPFRRFGLSILLAILAPGTVCWYASPHAAQALGVPLAWAGGIGDASSEPSSPDVHLLTNEMTPVPASLGTEVVNYYVELTSPVEAIDGPHVVTPNSYTLADVTQWAYDYSPAANLIDSEANAVMRSIDTSDPKSCCSARLVRDVLHEVALARRCDSALQARVAYHKLIAATRAVEVADGAIAVQEKMIALATEAERLEIPDTNTLKLHQTRLDLVDLKTEGFFSGLKLRQELSRLTGRSEAEVATATLSDSLPTEAPSIVAGDAVAIALIERHDLRAAQILCRDMNSCNIDAGRLLMGTLSPGLGLSLATATKGILKCLKDDNTDNDLNARRCQCREQQTSLRSVIRNETLQAVLDVRAAGARLKLVDEQLLFAAQRLDETRGKVQIDEVTRGSELMVELEVYQLRGKRLTRQKELAVAVDDLDHAQGNNRR